MMNLGELKNAFIEKYGKGFFSAYHSPGRVNLIGEHTDYNGGRVFPCALDLGITLLVRKTRGEVIRFASTNYDFSANIGLCDVGNKIKKEWVNYPLGVINQFINKGIQLSGMEMLYSGNIPIGAGLSSSASIEMVTAMALNDLFAVNLKMVELIKLSQRSENEFIGVNCGIMDQFTIGMGKKEHALALDCSTLDYEQVPAKMDGYKIVIVNTNKPRELINSKYNERRNECEMAVKYISKEKTIENLCQLTNEEFAQLKDTIPDEVVMRRARHVISENQRVFDAVGALKRGNLHLFGILMNESHLSLKKDYEVTGTELDTLAEEAQKVQGVLGARMTGAGFGGCTVNLVKTDVIDDFCKIVSANYKKKTGYTADFYVAGIGDGTRKIE